MKSTMKERTKIALFLIYAYGGLMVCISHEVNVVNHTGTNRQITVGEWTIDLANGGIYRFEDVPAGLSVVSSNGGWAVSLDDYMSLAEAERALLTLASSNGVEQVMIRVGSMPGKWVQHGKWIAFTVVGFALAMGLVRTVKTALPERD